MSKNFELLQQAEIGLGTVATPAGAGIGNSERDRSRSATGNVSSAVPAVREESLKLVQRLFLAPGQPAPKAVMFVAIDSANGSSRLCALTAELLSETIRGSVCLVEGNFRTPSLPGVFGIDNHHGLTDSLRQVGPIRGFAKQVGGQSLWLLSSGSLGKDSLNLLNSDRMKERIAELRSEFDYLLIDVPPFNAYADALVFGRLTDGVVLVLEANQTRREAAQRVAESLRSAGIPVLGAVLNNRTFPIPGALYKRI